MTTTFVTTEAALNAAIVNANTLSGQGAVTIDVAGSISLTGQLEAIDLASGNTWSSREAPALAG